MQLAHKHSILGGTFDHFHAGHKHFISAAFEASEKVTIGLVAENSLLTDKSFISTIEDYKTRKESVNSFISEMGFPSPFKIVPISDFYGTTLTDKSIDAIFVTPHGLENAEIINKKRIVIDLPEIEISLVEFLRGEDQEIISSTRIRGGEIDRDGFPYIKLFEDTLFLPDELRSSVKILGETKRNIEDIEYVGYPFLISVGDETTLNFLKAGIIPNICVVDFKIQRKSLENPLFKADVEIENQPGEIQSTAVTVIKSAIDSMINGKKTKIKVNGEEDLLVMPLVMLAPLGSLIVYGQPGLGVDVVEASEEKKEKTAKLLKKFSQQ